MGVVGFIRLGDRSTGISHDLNRCKRAKHTYVVIEGKGECCLAAYLLPRRVYQPLHSRVDSPLVLPQPVPGAGQYDQLFGLACFLK